MSITKNKKRLRGVSLFASAGIGETFFEKAGIDIVVANELLEDRASLYSNLYKNTKMIQGDILDDNVFQKIVSNSKGKIDFLIATPPCQGISVAGKNRNLKTMLKDKRNYLTLKILDFIDIKKPDYILIENVPSFLKLKLPFRNKLHTVLEILEILYSKEYDIESKILNSSDYGVPQKRNRAVVKMYKKNLNWNWPKKETVKTVAEAIGDLPSLEAGEKSGLPWHFARNHSKNHIVWMKNTPTGNSAFQNKKHFPRKTNGERINSYMTTYHRIKWDEPAPTITMRNDAISSQLNVHPGRQLKDGTYSDARVLTPLELMLLTSLPKNWNISKDTPEILVRKCIGESVPPLLLKKIVSKITLLAASPGN